MKNIKYCKNIQKKLLEIILENPGYSKKSMISFSLDTLKPDFPEVDEKDILANIDYLIDESFIVEIYNEPTQVGNTHQKEFFSLRIHSYGVKFLQPDHVINPEEMVSI